jgi:aminoglycoside phosphotransferase (APT) family kinase protein
MTSSQTQKVRKGEEIPLQPLHRYIQENIENLPDHPLEVSQFVSGFSNLTYLLKIGEWEVVLRRAPHGNVAAKAHDMQREFRILQAIHAFFPLAPKPYLYCEDETIIGKPFLLMERKKGMLVEDSAVQNHLTMEDGEKLSKLMVNHLVELHNIPYEKTKLTEMANPNGFMERQVTGWIHRYEKAATEEIPVAKTLTGWLMEHIPKNHDFSIIHYDYKFNNMLFSQDLNSVVGIVDWEMTTIGDPLADLGVAMSYWIQDTDSEVLKSIFSPVPITMKPGFYSRDQFIQAYAEKSGRDVSNFPYYLAFSYFKLAVISEQIFKRYDLKQTQDERFKDFHQHTKNLMDEAWKIASRQVG